MTNRQPCVVVWEKNSREVFAYPPYAETDEEALRKAAGVFMKLHDGNKEIFTKARNEAVVYWKNSLRYKQYIDPARQLRNLYEQKRDRSKVEKTLYKTEKKQNPLPAFSSQKKRKENEIPSDQMSLF